jgi:hypothetical protein
MKNNNLLQVFKNFIISNKSKKIIFIFLLCTFSLGVIAKPKLPSKEQVGMFKNSVTCVVIDNGGLLYNALLKEAIQKYWDITQFEFINEKEFERRRYDSRYSFLVLMEGVFDNDPGGVVYDYLSLVLGDPAKDLIDMPQICSFPIAYTDDDNLYYGYVLPSAIKFMQTHARNLESKRFFISLKGLKYYNGSRTFKGKALLLNKNMMAKDADTERKIKNVYPYYFKLLDTEEIQKELSVNPTNILFVFHVGPNEQSGAGKCFEMIFDTNGNLYYYNSRKITNDNEDGFNLNDFKHLR